MSVRGHREHPEGAPPRIEVSRWETFSRPGGSSRLRTDVKRLKGWSPATRTRCFARPRVRRLSAFG